MKKTAYLVIPKLIEQPTWGGTYIATLKQWHTRPQLAGKLIGQSYELFSASQLSLLEDTRDPQFIGELTALSDVTKHTSPNQSVPLTQLISTDAREILGSDYVSRFGPNMRLLIKFTQALGNSFQLHIKDGATHPKWKPKPESWYFFEPGYITLGVKPGVDWKKYETHCVQLHEEIIIIGNEIKSGKRTLEAAKVEIKKRIEQYNPWQFVNELYPQKDELIDLSPCGIHHSWEEDTKRLPNGNILYELQLDVRDEEATIRNFDKGKISADGSSRQLHIADYFEHIDRSEKANNPQTHNLKAEILEESATVKHEKFMRTNYYNLDKVTLTSPNSSFTEMIDGFRHVFVKSGQISLIAGSTTLHITAGHAAFIPASTRQYEIASKNNAAEVLISY